MNIFIFKPKRTTFTVVCRLFPSPLFSVLHFFFIAITLYFRGIGSHISILVHQLANKYIYNFIIDTITSMYNIKHCCHVVYQCICTRSLCIYETSIWILLKSWVSLCALCIRSSFSIKSCLLWQNKTIKTQMEMTIENVKNEEDEMIMNCVVVVGHVQLAV